MSFKPTEIFKESFRKSLMAYTVTAFIVSGIAFNEGKITQGLYILGTVIFAMVILGISYFPYFVKFIREQYEAFVTYKNVAPLVSEINDTLTTLKHEKSNEAIVTDISKNTPEIAVNNADISLMHEFKELKDRLGLE